MNSQLFTIKAKKLGVKLANIRQKMGVSIDDLSLWSGFSVGLIEQIEKGERSPSLPQLEVISFMLGISIENLVNGDLTEKPPLNLTSEFFNKYEGLRNRLIGVLLKKARISKNLSLESVAEKCAISGEKLDQYESGAISIPYPDFECLCVFLNLSISSLISQKGPFSKQYNQTENLSRSENTNHLPNDLSDFVSNPANLPYIELAKRLSVMDAAKLRSIAEGLLEITY
ncbi:MAG: hypothetical protein C0401_04205 [Anaerolinea sp.]|nr:hypothetical protein [Anaerolinea sp.]